MAQCCGGWLQHAAPNAGAAHGICSHRTVNMPYELRPQGLLLPPVFYQLPDHVLYRIALLALSHHSPRAATATDCGHDHARHTKVGSRHAFVL